MTRRAAIMTAAAVAAALGEGRAAPTENIPPPDPIDIAIESYSKVEAYTTTLISRNGAGGEVIRYSFERPGRVRMEFERPYKGAVLTYEPSENVVRVRPFPAMEFLTFSFDPSSRFVRSSRGHRVDESDIGALLKAVAELKEDGAVELLGMEETDGATVRVVAVTGADGKTVDTDVHRYVLRLDAASHLPVRAEAYNEADALVEDVLFKDLVVRGPAR